MIEHLKVLVALPLSLFATAAMAADSPGSASRGTSSVNTCTRTSLGTFWIVENQAVITVRGATDDGRMVPKWTVDMGRLNDELVHYLESLPSERIALHGTDLRVGASFIAVVPQSAGRGTSGDVAILVGPDKGGVKVRRGPNNSYVMAGSQPTAADYWDVKILDESDCGIAVAAFSRTVVVPDIEPTSR